MTVTSTCYGPTADGGWRELGSGDAALTSSTHAEIRAYNEARPKSLTATRYRFEQNAFPCAPCTETFRRESLKGIAFEFHCSNEGAYAVECTYLPRGDPRNIDPTLTGTLRISGGNVSGLYGTTIYPADTPPVATTGSGGGKKGG